MEEPFFYYCFETLYWTGIREGELLALTMKDINLNNKTISISKTYQTINGIPMVGPPKTSRGIRTVSIPEHLCNNLNDYFNMCYDKDSRRIFPTSKAALSRALTRGYTKAGVKRIRVHDLHHPYVKHTTKNISLQKQKSQTTNRFDSLGFLFSLNSMPSIKLIIVISANQKSS